MRVLLDATPLITGGGGVARYSRELWRALDEQGVDTSAVAFGRAALPVPARVRHVRVPLRSLHWMWRRVHWPPVDRFDRRADVVHTLDLVPGPARRPRVATLHDVAAVERPDLHGSRHVAIQRAQLAALSDVEVVCCVSQATASAAARHGLDPARLHVTPLGRPALAEPARPAAALPERFVLAVGAPIARRGFDVLLRAMAEVDSALSVVFAGGWEGSDLPALAARLGVEERVTVLGRLVDANLAWLYAHAVALCLPSRAEGFGLPVVEAMGAGLPVVASDLDVVREVAADAVVLVPVDDVHALATAITRVATDADLVATLRDAGRARAARFTWTVTAERTMEGYRRALNA